MGFVFRSDGFPRIYLKISLMEFHMIDQQSDDTNTRWKWNYLNLNAILASHFSAFLSFWCHFTISHDPRIFCLLAGPWFDIKKKTKKKKTKTYSSRSTRSIWFYYLPKDHADYRSRWFHRNCIHSVSILVIFTKEDNYKKYIMTSIVCMMYVLWSSIIQNVREQWPMIGSGFLLHVPGKNEGCMKWSICYSQKCLTLVRIAKNLTSGNKKFSGPLRQNSLEGYQTCYIHELNWSEHHFTKY